MKELDSYRVILHSSLTAPMLLSGVPRRFALINGTSCAAVVLGLHAFYLLPIFIVLHLLVAILTKKDPYFLEIFMRNLKYKRYYR